MSESADAAVAACAPVPGLRDAYQRVLDDIRAMPANKLVPINIDIPTTVTTALGAWPQIRVLRPRVAELPHFDLAAFDKIEDYALALALGYAHARHNIATTPAESLPELSVAATSLRQWLLTDATSLAQRGLIDGERLKDLKGPNGYRNLSFDLERLAALLRDNWEQIGDKTPTTPPELDEAETLADRLLTAVGIRNQAPATAAETADIRQRAFSLLVNAYGQARRAIGYLRWQEDDLEQIAPSLYTARAAGRRKSQPKTPVPDVRAADRSRLNAADRDVALGRDNPSSLDGGAAWGTERAR
jgi:hypothetical protein